MFIPHRMNRRLTILLVGVLAASGGACRIDARGSRVTGGFERSLPANGPLELSVRTGSGSIRINTGPEAVVRIVARIEAEERLWSSSSVTDQVREIEAHPPIVQNGTSIEVGRLPSRLGDHVSISYEITMPAAARLELRSGSGDQWVSAAQGPVDAGTGSGGIRLGAISGVVSATTGSGDIEVMSASGLHAIAGSGSIDARDVRGGVTARTGSGNIQIAGQPDEPWSVTAGSGSIALRLSEGVAFDLDARTGSGAIHSTQPLEVRNALARNRLVGRAHGGGPQITVSTGSGSIRIEESSPARAPAF